MPWIEELEELFVLRPELLASFLSALSSVMLEAVSLSRATPPRFVGD